MKIKMKKRHIIAAAVNAVCIAGFVVLRIIGSSQAASQSYNFACERWGGEDSGSYSQFSLFAAKSAGFSKDNLVMLRQNVLDTLKTVSIAPEEGKKLCPDCYSAPIGQASIKGNLSGRSEAELTAVGGDFFTINDFKLIDGAFFSDEDMIQDGAVIDRDLAWALYGGSEVAGMDMYINGTKYYISGVVENPKTDEEKKCSGELPRAYISYDGASAFADGTDTENPKFTEVSCYELVMPDPVEGYAAQTIKQFAEGFGKSVSFVQNNSRFGFFKRIGAFRKLSDTAVSDSGIIYPYWENASRIVEFRLSMLYMAALLLLIIPAVTAVWLIAQGIKYIKKNKRKITSDTAALFKKLKRKKVTASESENSELIPVENQLSAENDI